MKTLNNAVEVAQVEGNFFTLTEAVETIIETIENHDALSGSDLHHYAFNMDIYIVGTYKAKKALEEYGVFEAIEVIKEYEMDHFGEIYTDFSSPEKVANMLWYIVGDEVVNILADKLFNERDVHLHDVELNAGSEERSELLELLRESIEVKNEIISLEKFKKDMNWTQFEFTDEQLERIHGGIIEDEYSTFSEVESDDMFEYADLSCDDSLIALIENLLDLESDEKTYECLTNRYGFVCDLYYLKDDDAYCLVAENR